MGSGGGNQTQTQTTSLPPFVAEAAKKYLTALQGITLPGGNIAPSPLPYQAVAPETPQQLQAQQLTSSETYGPSGAPPGSGGPNVDPNGLIQSVAGTPFWQQQMQGSPQIQNAFSRPALGQLASLYFGMGQ